MATSGSIDFTVTRDQIIKDSLLLIGAVGAEESVDSSDQAIAARMLNMMIKDWHNKGVNLWRYQEGILFLDTQNQASYTLASGSSGDDFTDSAVITTLGAAEAASQTELTVTSSTGMTASDYIGVVLDDGTLHETTIVSVDNSTTITITSGLASAAASGNKVYTYTTKGNRPIRIDSVRWRDSSDLDRELNEISRDEYFELPTKETSNGDPSAFYYDPRRGNTQGGILYLWPRPNDLSGHLRVTYTRTIEDFDNATDNPDFPQEWLLTLVYGLAALLAPLYGKDQKLTESIGIIAEQKLQDALDYDNQPESSFIVPDWRND